MYLNYYGQSNSNILTSNTFDDGQWPQEEADYLKAGRVIYIENTGEYNIITSSELIDAGDDEYKISITCDNNFSSAFSNSNVRVVLGLAYSSCAHAEGRNTTAVE